MQCHLVLQEKYKRQIGIGTTTQEHMAKRKVVSRASFSMVYHKISVLFYINKNIIKITELKYEGLLLIAYYTYIYLYVPKSLYHEMLLILSVSVSFP